MRSATRGTVHGGTYGPVHGATRGRARGATCSTTRGRGRGVTRGTAGGAAHGSTRNTRILSRGNIHGNKFNELHQHLPNLLSANKTSTGNSCGQFMKTGQKRKTHYNRLFQSHSKQIAFEILPPSDDSKHVWLIFLLEVLGHIDMLQGSNLFEYVMIIALYWLREAVCTLVLLCKMFLQLIVQQILDSNARCLIGRYLEMERNTAGHLALQILVDV